MTNRRNFLKTSGLGAGAMALAPSFHQSFATAGSNGIPKRFVFIRKSSGIRPLETDDADLRGAGNGH